MQVIRHCHHYHYGIGGAFLNGLCALLFIALLVKLWYIVIPFVLVAGLVLGTVRARRQQPASSAAPANPTGGVPQAHYSDRR